MTEADRKSLRVDVTPGPSGAVVYVRGSAGMAETDAIRRPLDDLVRRKAPLIVLDLSEMDFICSAGLGVLIEAHRQSHEHQGQVRLVNPQPAVRQLLEVTNLTRLFSIYATIEKAIKA